MQLPVPLSFHCLLSLSNLNNLALLVNCQPQFNSIVDKISTKNKTTSRLNTSTYILNKTSSSSSSVLTSTSFKLALVPLKFSSSGLVEEEASSSFSS